MSQVTDTILRTGHDFKVGHKVKLRATYLRSGHLSI
jgi:hypothetical protein